MCCASDNWLNLLRRSVWTCLFGLVSTFYLTPSYGALIDASRRIDWAAAANSGRTLPARNVVCARLGPTHSSSEINAAIASCPPGQVVLFAAGHYRLSGGIVVSGRDDITLRGAGPEQTVFEFDDVDACGGLGGALCLRGTDLNFVGAPGQIRRWSGGYAKGSNVVRLDSTVGLQPGAILFLDQLDARLDESTSPHVCREPGVCCVNCATPGRRSERSRSQVQASRVLAVTANEASISPPIAWPNYGEPGRNPQAWYAAAPALKGIVVEDLAVDTNSSRRADGAAIMVYGVVNSWIHNVRVVHCPQKCVWLYQSVGVSVTDSYFFDKRGSDESQRGSESYGVDAYLSSDWLVQNNIFHHLAAPMICESGVAGVVSYNFSTDHFYSTSRPDWGQASQVLHGVCGYVLFEGNVGTGLSQDNVNGPSFFITAFRNRWSGWEQGKSRQTAPIIIYAASGYTNVIGNVLGTSGYHRKYSSSPRSRDDCDESIFVLGFKGHCRGTPDSSVDDPERTMLRWGNVDVVEGRARFDPAEVPSKNGVSFSSEVPANGELPPSLYLSKRPQWFESYVVPYPATGPDVVGGDVSGVFGHAFKIPAERCYEALGKNGGMLVFDARRCYRSSRRRRRFRAAPG